jgi:6-phosphogluconolactonase (cycloisomerase 2 family)
MKSWKWAWLLLAALPFFSGCKGFWDAPSGSGGSGGNGTASGVFYVLNQKTTQLAGFTFAASSTSLTAVSNSPYTIAAQPYALAISPSGSYLYLSTPVGIYAYSIGTGGALSILNGGQPISSDFAFTMQVDPSGSWLVEAVSGIPAVNAIPLDSATGILLNGGSEQSVTLPSGATAIQQLTISPSGSANTYVFVAMGSTGIAGIPFTATNNDPFGSATTIRPISNNGGDTTIAVDLSRSLLYVGETVAVTGTQPGGLRVFTIGANSTFTEISGSPYATGGVGPSAILPTTNYVYVANKAVTGSNSGNITGFTITLTGTVYSLTSISTISAGVATAGLAEDSTGTYLLAVNAGGSPDLNAFTFDSTTAGKLDSYATGSTGTDPVQAVAIAAVP